MSDGNDDDDVGERSRLLATQVDDHHLNQPDPDQKGTLHGLQFLILEVLLLAFFAVFVTYHLVAPKLRLVELSLCRQYYESRDPSVIEATGGWPYYEIEEARCKHNDIQRELSSIRSWGVVLDGICLFVTSVPYGLLADKYGRRLVIILCLVGQVLSNAWYIVVLDYLPIKLVLVSSAFMAVGGGPSLLLAITTTMLADVAPVELRSTVFYWLLSSYYLAYIVASGLVPFTMRVLWLPFAVALLSACIAVLITLAISVPTVQSESQRTSTNNPTSQSPDIEGKQRHVLATLPSKVINYVSAHTNLAIMMVLFPLMATRGTFPELVMPYVSKRYGWPLSRAGILDAIFGTVALLLGTLALPGLTKLLQRQVVVPIQADCLVAMYSSVAIGVGGFTIALAPSMAVMIVGWVSWSTGFGVRTAVLSMANSLVEPDQLARLNTAVLCIETMADIIVAPLIWQSWSAGLELDGKLALGLPWLIVVAAMLLVFMVLLFLYNMLVTKTSESLETSNSVPQGGSGSIEGRLS